MGDGDHHAQRVGPCDGFTAEIAHAGVAFAAPGRLAAFGVRRRTGAQVVVAGMDQAQVTRAARVRSRSEEHTSELQSLMRISYAVFCLKKKKTITLTSYITYTQKLN